MPHPLQFSCYTAGESDPVMLAAYITLNTPPSQPHLFLVTPYRPNLILLLFTPSTLLHVVLRVPDVLSSLPSFAQSTSCEKNTPSSFLAWKSFSDLSRLVPRFLVTITLMTFWGWGAGEQLLLRGLYPCWLVYFHHGLHPFSPWLIC